MMVSGVIVAVFIVYHLLHYTVMVQAVNLTGQDFDANRISRRSEAARHLQNDGPGIQQCRWSRCFIWWAWGCCACT